MNAAGEGAAGPDPWYGPAGHDFMTSNLNPVPGSIATEQSLFASEREYFMAGAHNRPVCGGTLSVVPGLQHLPAGCVLHSVTQPPRAGDVKHSLADLKDVSLLLHYEAETSLRNGLRSSLPYYRSLQS